MPRFPFPDDIRDPDREGPNPFADDDAHEPKAPVVENVYASTTQPSVYEPKYDAILGSRYRLVFALGLVGLVFSVLGGLGTLLWQLAWMISMS
ncbi:MAG: hypothetical protein KDA60_23040, partial [Planctomycetales bacterium]|nr:hypothetical protein [Planctomycetales bacterium]